MKHRIISHKQTGFNRMLVEVLLEGETEGEKKAIEATVNYEASEEQLQYVDWYVRNRVDLGPYTIAEIQDMRNNRWYLKVEKQTSIQNP